jgi:hypothetical protein
MGRPHLVVDDVYQETANVEWPLGELCTVDREILSMQAIKVPERTRIGDFVAYNNTAHEEPLKRATK